MWSEDHFKPAVRLILLQLSPFYIHVSASLPHKLARAYNIFNFLYPCHTLSLSVMTVNHPPFFFSFWENVLFSEEKPVSFYTACDSLEASGGPSRLQVSVHGWLDDSLGSCGLKGSCEGGEKYWKHSWMPLLSAGTKAVPHFTITVWAACTAAVVRSSSLSPPPRPGRTGTSHTHTVTIWRDKIKLSNYSHRNPVRHDNGII